MTETELDLFFNIAMLFCAVLAIFNFSRFRSRGPSAYVLGGAFLAFGATIKLLQLAMPTWLIGIFGGITALLLVMDLAIKSRKRSDL